MEDVIPAEALANYDAFPDRPSFSLAADGGVIRHEPGQPISLVMVPRTEEELERGARLLLLRASTPINPEDAWAYLGSWDLANRHTLEIPEFLVHGGMDLERGDTFLALADPNTLGLVARQGECSSVLIFNPPAVARLTPMVERGVFPVGPPARRIPPEPARVRQARLRIERRARALLFQYLAREQKWELRAHRRFTVVGQDGLTYRVYAWSGMNVRVFDGEKETQSLCVVPKPETPLPVFDLMLAQKVLLERHISKFMEMAVRRTL